MSRYICVSLSDKELQEIDQYVERNGMTRSKFLVRAALREARNGFEDIRKVKGIWNNLAGVFNNER